MVLYGERQVPLRVGKSNLRRSKRGQNAPTLNRFAGMGLAFVAVSNCREETAAGKLRALPLGPEPMIRRLGLIYRKDKALSKAALGFIQVVLDHLGDPKSALEKPCVVAS